MANFDEAYKPMQTDEGGYVNDLQDPGGETIQGIARNMNSKWEGWPIIDRLKTRSDWPKTDSSISIYLASNPDLQEMIKHFYQDQYWDVIQGDCINDQKVADTIFNFGINAGIKTSISIAQMVVGCAADGVIGGETIAKLNSEDPGRFLADFTLAKIARYISIVKKKPISIKYFYGWVKRAMEYKS